MRRSFIAAAATAAVMGTGLVSTAAVASPPPRDARPASEILRQVEQRPDFGYLEEMEWDDDGYWEIEYRTRDGGKVKLYLDPRTGQPRRR